MGTAVGSALASPWEFDRRHCVLGVALAARDWYCEGVLAGKLEIGKVFEDERVLAFHHPKPSSPVHVVVIPKRHIASLLEAEAADGPLLASMVLAVQEAARVTGLDKTGFYVRANCAPGEVAPHMHWHIRGPGIS